MKTAVQTDPETGTRTYAFEVEAHEMLLPITPNERAVLDMELKAPTDTYRQLGVLVAAVDREHYRHAMNQADENRPRILLPAGVGAR